MIINYLYYRLYRFFEITENNFAPKGMRIPEFIAYFTTVFLFELNFISIDLLLKNIFGYSFLVLSSELMSIVCAILLMIGLYFQFIWKRKYLNIINRYKQESQKNRILSISFTIFYIVISIGLLFIIPTK